MVRMGRLGSLVLVGGFLCAISAPAEADYFMSVVAGGTGGTTDIIKVDAKPGDKVSLDVFMASDAANELDTAVFDLKFSQGGLWLTDFGWGNNFTTGGPTDFTIPSISEVHATPYKLGVIKFNANTDPPFGTVFDVGVLVSMNLLIPEDYLEGLEEKTVLINVNPITIANFTGSSEMLPTVHTPDKFVLNVVPEPATLALLGFAGLVALRRRRS